jgi:hypothetical protein
VSQTVPPTLALPVTGPQHAAAGPHHETPDRIDGPSVAALVAGLLGLVVPLVSVLAIVLGGIGAERTARRGTRGRAAARTGMTLGVVEVLVTAVVVGGAWWAWSTFGDDLREGLDRASAASKQYAALADEVDRLADGDLGALRDLASGLSLGDVRDLIGTAANVDELSSLAGDCQAGDPAACRQLLEAVPSGLVDDVPARD